MIRIGKRHKKYGKGIAGIASLLPGPNQVKVGFPAGEADNDVIQRAIWQEFGTQGGASGGGWGGPVPERPFMRNALRDGQGSNKAMMKTEARRIIVKAMKGQDVAVAKRLALRRLGVKVQGDIQASIISLQSPPNSPTTIALKGSSNPLIDSGEMLGAVTFKVEE